MEDRDQQILIAGAGLAGLTAALRLCQEGVPVTVLEKRPRAGGRVYSFRDRATGDEVDNGQHVYLGCCTAFIELMEEVGSPVREQLQDELRIVLRSPDRNRYVLEENSWLPGPLNLLPLLMNASFLSWSERYGVASCFRTIATMSEDRRRELDGCSMASWLRDQGQTERAIETFWNIFILSTLNAGAESVSAASAIFVFSEGLLSKKDAGRIGVADRGQTPFYITPLVDRIESLGGTVEFRRPVRELVFERNCCAGVRLDNEEVRKGRDVILALPPWRLKELLDRTGRALPLSDRLEPFEPAPILCVNIWLDESLVREPFVALLHGNFDWVFNRTDIERRERDETQHLSLVKSAAFDMLEQSLDDLKKSAVQELSRYYSDFEKRMVSGIRVTKEPRATFIPRPGMEAIRPGSDSGTEGVYLAGAWTDTGWPSTMESAVRSGNRVASKILSAEASAKEEHTG